MPEPSPHQPLAASDRTARFGPFELNLVVPELRRQGRVVNVQQQSLRILIYLVEHAGAVVSREELKTAVWPSGTYVEFDAGLYTAINRLRQALGDSASNPYFIETVPKLGYRFLSPVQLDEPAPILEAELEPLPAPADAAPPPAADPRVATEPPKPRPHRAMLLPAWQWITAGVLAGVLLAGGGWAFWSRLRPAPPVLDHLRPFTLAHGVYSRPAFSPDGEMLAFDWKGPHDNHLNIYVQRLDAANPVRLSNDTVEERRPRWSPDGRQIAFLRFVNSTMLAIVSVPLVGTEERTWTQFRRGATPWFDWSGDGKWFAVAEPLSPGTPPAVVLISTATGERRALTTPPAGWRGDSEPMFAPDSTRVVFRRTKPPSGVEDLYEVPLAGGEPKRLTYDDRSIHAFCFTPEGGLLFPSTRESSLSALWWMAPHGGRLSRLTTSTFDVSSPAMSRDGKHIAFSKPVYDVNIWRVNADGSGNASPVIDSDLADTGGQFSPDGHRLAFHSNRSGTDEIWVSNPQGADAVRLTDSRGAAMSNPRWSPDGKRIAFEWQISGMSGIYVIASDGGGSAPRKLVADEFQNIVPSWSHDGRFVYYTSNRSGPQQYTAWRVPADGSGTGVPVSAKPGFAPRESPDGRYLYYFRDGGIWRQPLPNGVPSGTETQVVSGMRAGDWGSWTPGNDGVYYIPDHENGDAKIQYLDLTFSAVRTVYTLQKPPVFGNSSLSLSPDGKTLLFAQIDQNDSRIFLQ